MKRGARQGGSSSDVIVEAHADSQFEIQFVCSPAVSVSSSDSTSNFQRIGPIEFPSTDHLPELTVDQVITVSHGLVLLLGLGIQVDSCPISFAVSAALANHSL